MDMVCVSAQANYAGRAADQRYYITGLFKNIYDRVAENGQFHPTRDLRRPQIITLNQEEDVIVKMASEAQLRTRALSAITGLSFSSQSIKKRRLRILPFYSSAEQLAIDFY